MKTPSESKDVRLVDVHLTIVCRGQENRAERVMMKPNDLRRLGRSRSCVLEGVEVPAGPWKIQGIDSRVHMSLFELARSIPGVVMSITVSNPPAPLAKLLREVTRAKIDLAVDPLRMRLPIGQRTTDGRLFRLAPNLVDKIPAGSLAEEVRGAISAIMRKTRGEKRYAQKDRAIIKYWFEELCTSKTLLDNSSRLLYLICEQAPSLTTDDLLKIAGTREELRGWFDEILSRSRTAPRRRPSDGLFAALGVALTKLGHAKFKVI